jgi:hypothetical protein
MTNQKLSPVVINGAVALFMYRYFMRLTPPGPYSERVFAVLLRDLKRGLDEAGLNV